MTTHNVHIFNRNIFMESEKSIFVIFRSLKGVDVPFGWPSPAAFGVLGVVLKTAGEGQPKFQLELST